MKSRELSKAHYGAIEVHPGAIEGLGIPLDKDPDPLKNREPDPHQVKITWIRTELESRVRRYIKCAYKIRIA